MLSIVHFVPAGQSSGDVRLIDLSGSIGYRIGRLDVYYNSQWGTVCHDGFGPTGALVACRQLGFLGYVAYGVVRRYKYTNNYSLRKTNYYYRQ